MIDADPLKHSCTYCHSASSQVLFVFIKLLSNLNYTSANNNYNT